MAQKVYITPNGLYIHKESDDMMAVFPVITTMSQAKAVEAVVSVAHCQDGDGTLEIIEASGCDEVYRMVREECLAQEEALALSRLRVDAANTARRPPCVESADAVRYSARREYLNLAEKLEKMQEDDDASPEKLEALGKKVERAAEKSAFAGQQFRRIYDEQTEKELGRLLAAKQEAAAA